jgi:hypothetical protein
VRVVTGGLPNHSLFALPDREAKSVHDGGLILWQDLPLDIKSYGALVQS